MLVPLLKRKEGQQQPKCHQGTKILLYLPTFCLKNISFIGPINFSVQGHLLEWIWLFGFDKKKKSEAPFCLFYMLWYHKIKCDITKDTLWCHKMTGIFISTFYFAISLIEFQEKMNRYCYITKFILWSQNLWIYNMGFRIMSQIESSLH